MQILGLECENLGFAGFRVEPQEREIRPRRFERRLPSPDLDDENSVRREAATSIVENAADEIETISAPEMGELRLGSILRRKRLDGLRRDVRRIRDNEIVASRRNPVEEISLEGANALSEPIVADVALGHGERIVRDVAGMNFRGRKCLRREDREAPGPGAKIENAIDG